MVSMYLIAMREYFRNPNEQNKKSALQYLETFIYYSGKTSNGIEMIHNKPKIRITYG